MEEVANDNLKIYPVIEGFLGSYTIFLFYLNFFMVFAPGMWFIYTQIDKMGKEGNEIDLGSIIFFLERLQSIGRIIGDFIRNSNKFE